jgi:hypothetical protein
MRLFRRIFNREGGATPEIPPLMMVPERPPKKKNSAVGNLPEGPSALSETIREKKAETVPASFPVDSLLDEVVDGFDQAFDNASSSGQTTYPEVKDVCTEAEMAALQTLFGEIASQYARPINCFILELKQGTATKERLEICQTALHSILGASESMNLVRATSAMKDFDRVLRIAQTTSPHLIDGETRRRILASYQELTEVQPQVFLSGQQEQNHENIIIKSLLKQIPGLGRVTIRKLYGAGLGSLNALLLANKQDLNAATGIPIKMCEHICDKFQRYRVETEGEDLSSEHTVGSYSRLASLVKKLGCLHQEFEHSRLAQGPNPIPSGEKPPLRQQRQQCFLQIVGILAEMHEITLINAIYKLPFRRRLQRLEEYLNTPAARRRYSFHSPVGALVRT